MGHAPVVSPHLSFYIDGYNLYYSLLEFCDNWDVVNGKKSRHRRDCDVRHCGASKYKWINFKLLCERIARNHNFHPKNIQDVNFFTSTPNETASNYHRHRIFQKVQEFYGCKIVTGRFNQYKEEKETDINIVIKIIEDVLYNNVKTIFLVTNDSDFVPLIHFLKRNFQDVKIFLYTPPNRHTVRFLREAMCHYYDKSITALNKNKIVNRDIYVYQISGKLMLQCKLPDVVPNLFDDNGNPVINPYKVDF